MLVSTIISRRHRIRRERKEATIEPGGDYAEDEYDDQASSGGYDDEKDDDSEDLIGDNEEEDDGPSTISNHGARSTPRWEILSTIGEGDKTTTLNYREQRITNMDILNTFDEDGGTTKPAHFTTTITESTETGDSVVPTGRWIIEHNPHKLFFFYIVVVSSYYLCVSHN